jgi:hypothetical protein
MMYKEILGERGGSVVVGEYHRTGHSPFRNGCSRRSGQTQSLRIVRYLFSQTLPMIVVAMSWFSASSEKTK